MSADALRQLEDWAGALLAQLQPAARRQLTRTLAQELRRRQQRRIAAQRHPDGSAYSPRKPQLRKKRGQIRQRAMFSKLRTARWLKTRNTTQAAEVGFVGRVVRLARVHQEGLHDRAHPKAGLVAYPRRELLGLAEADREWVQDMLVAHLSARLRG